MAHNDPTLSEIMNHFFISHMTHNFLTLFEIMIHCVISLAMPAYH